MSKRPKFATSAVDTEKSNGEITFIAARNVKNLNGWTYETSTLQAQNANGDFNTLSHEWQEVAIPLMLNHKGDTDEKVGNIYQARLISDGDEELVEMQAEWFKGDKAQETRQRVLDNELTDVSITTDWGSGYSDEDDFDTLKNAHIIEVSVVYAGAEPKAKITAKNSVDKDDEHKETEPTVVNLTVATETLQKIVNEAAEKLRNQLKEEKETEVVTQPDRKATTENKVATKEQVLNALTKLAENGAIRNMNRSQVIEAVKNEVSIMDGDTAYETPDAVLAELLADNKPTDILDTFKTVPARKFTTAKEKRSDADLARAGQWSKGQQKQIQTLRLDAQKLDTGYIYKLQEISLEDWDDDFGDMLYNFIKSELPQKVSEEEERAFVVGDGRDSENNRKIDHIVSFETAAEDSDNVHVVKYDGTGASSAFEAALDGVTKLYETGTKYAVMNTKTLTAMRKVGLTTASGLPFTTDVVAGSIGVDRIFEREYVADDVVYAYVGPKVYRLNAGLPGRTIEQYDIDYNNQKIEFIRKAGGEATGIASAVKITLPTTVSA